MMTTKAGEESKVDQVLPYFILTKLPAGVAGLVIAGVLAAAMSSLDSSINAIATVSVVDIVKRYLAPGRNDRFYLVAAWIISTVTAGLMIVGALIIAGIPKESMADLGMILFSIFGGCVFGLFMIGFFTRRVDYGSVSVALGVAVAFNVYLMLNSFGLLPDRLSIPAHAYWVGVLVNLAFVTMAYLVSLVRSGPRKNLAGLTVWTMQDGDSPGTTASDPEGKR